VYCRSQATIKILYIGLQASVTMVKPFETRPAPSSIKSIAISIFNIPTAFNQPSVIDIGVEATRQQIEMSVKAPVLRCAVRAPFLAVASIPKLIDAVFDFIKFRKGQASVRELNLMFGYQKCLRKALRTLKEEGRIAESKIFGHDCMIVRCYRISKHSECPWILQSMIYNFSFHSHKMK